ncbi:MAG: PspC domain-containing protein [Salinivirgaceae bacterium]|jgi:phage shock protein PspC (stress-responsive transcriptional regulator)|nr:PspC domain-containing protein [Salinivirgaceae bacterium]
MKETTTINISGIIFHIDNDAFELLKSYFLKLKRKFGDTAEGKEIINDIELRIAELLQEKLNDKKEVINEIDIHQVITTMGDPEDLDAESSGEEAEEPIYNSSKQRRLYRDGDNMMLGGVCAGMGHYFGMDPVLIRVLTVIFTLFYGVGFLIYIVMWAFIPKAITTTQKLEMKGEPVTAENIKRTIKENYEDVKNSGTFRKAQEGFDKGSTALGSFVRFILRFIVIVIGASMVLGTVVGIVAIINLFLFAAPPVLFGSGLHGAFFPFLNMFFQNELTMIIFVIAIVLLSIIPILLILFLGVKMVFQFKTNNKAIGLSALGIWLIALALVTAISISTGMRYSESITHENVHEIANPAGKTMYLQLESNNYSLDELSHSSFKINKDEKLLYRRPELDIERSMTGRFELEVRKKIRGQNREKAYFAAEIISYNFTQTDSVLVFDEYYTTDWKHIGKVDDYDLTLYVPENYSIVFDKELYKIVDDIDKAEHISNENMMGKKWIMTHSGLSRMR